MGWASGGEVFDPVALALINNRATDEMKTAVLTDLIAALQNRDWDTEGESLGEYQDDPAIVEAFRRNGVIIACQAENQDVHVTQWCTLERGHGGESHEDTGGRRWPAAGE